MDILDDMGVSKLSATVFFKVNYSFKMIVDPELKSQLVGHIYFHIILIFFFCP